MKRLRRYLICILMWFILWMTWEIIFADFDGAVKDEETLELTDEYDTLAVLLAVLCVTGGAAVVDYNRIQKLKAKIPGLRGDVQALEERRVHQLDKANRLVDKYMAHEKSVQKSVAHSHVKKASDFSHYMEMFPDLKANEAVATLLAQMNQIEADLLVGKTILNDGITEYNASIHLFPISIFRRVLKLEDIEIRIDRDKRIWEDEISDEELGIG